MPEKTSDTSIAGEVELAVGRLSSLSILPTVATRFVSQLFGMQLSPSDLTEIIESDPGFAASILALMYQQGICISDEDFTIHQALEQIPLGLIHDTFFSVPVYHAWQQDDKRAAFRKQLILHSLSVACCAKKIAETASLGVNSELAYLAGLLHNIGNLALDEAMPRSFGTIVEEAKSQKTSICDIQRKHLGTDYTILGKRLAQRWHFPEAITLAIWLHRSDTTAISQSMPEAKIAQAVQLADLLARQSGMGDSGSYDSPARPDKLAKSLGITPEQLQQFGDELAGLVEKKSKLLDLERPGAIKDYCSALGSAAAQLAHSNTKLSQENHRLQTVSGHLNFITEFMGSIDPAGSPIDIAENFAVRWQKFYQTGPVCLYLTGGNNCQAVLAESSSETKTVILKAPAQAPLIPAMVQKNFAIVDAHEWDDWLFEQLDIDFVLNKTKLIPLLSKGKAIGAIVFELRYPAETKELLENFKVLSSVAGTVLDTASSRSRQQQFAELFAQVFSQPKNIEQQVNLETPAPATSAQPESVEADLLTALAEMAAGAAHELNNPLSVISGRAQLLTESETDPEKIQILTQITENTKELTAIINGLLSFASPQTPRPTDTSVKQILDEALQLAARKTNTEHINSQTEIADGLNTVFVDSAQIVSAVANVIANSIESYTGNLGPIKITAEPQASDNFVKLQITDLGCGMEPEIIKKSTQPFFSAKPAGRKRGMGLAYTNRLIHLNNGSLDIISKPGNGTTVAISLPTT